MTDVPEAANVLVLAPATAAHVTRGSTQMVAGCGHAAWISLNAAFHMQEHPDTETLCLTCFQAESDVDVETGTLPGAAFELSAALGIPLDKIDGKIAEGIEILKAQRAQRA